MHPSIALKENLLFVKGLMDEPEYVNEEGIENLINIWKKVYFDGVPERAIIGTNYARGALDVLSFLLDRRRDLFEKMESQFMNLYNGNDVDYVKTPARIVLEKLGKL